jgi:hypothetical protein
VVEHLPSKHEVLPKNKKCLKNNTRAGGVTQVVECKLETLKSSPSTDKKRKRTPITWEAEVKASRDYIVRVCIEK